MPRDSNGTYSLPAGNPVVTLTPISSTWANTTLDDIGNALTDSLDRAGSGPMTGQLKLANGTAGAPGLSWGTETNSGLYRAGAGDFRYSVLAADVFQITAALVKSFAPTFQIANGAPRTLWDETDAPLNERLYDWVQSAGNLALRTRTDADDVGVDIFSIIRAGTAITSKTWPTGTNIFGDQVRPGTDAAVDTGDASFRWRRVYTADVRIDDNSIFLDQDGAGILRLGGVGSDWSRVDCAYPTRFTFPSAGGVASLQLTSTLPVLEANDTDAAADAKIWDHVYQTGVLSDRLVNDARSVALSYRTVTRTGVTSAVVNYPTGTQLQALGREVGYRNANRNTQNAGYVFVADDAGRAVAAGSAGNFTVNNNVFQAGDMVIFENTAGTCTIVQGAGVTLRLVGSAATTGSRTSTSFSLGYIYAQTPSVFLVGGIGIS